MTTDNRVTIYIDDREVKARPGSVVLEAAIEAGIYVPYLCYHPGMKPFAACRMCLVEEEVEREVDRDGERVREKQLRPPSASCTMPIREGMVIRSATDNVRQIQRSTMEMLISEHPHGCLTCHRIELCGPEDICQRHVSVNDRCVFCPKNERCELKDSVRFLGMDLNSPLSYKTRDLEVEASDPFYDRDYNLCIVCGRCVRVCEEVRGDNAITFVERAGQALVGTSRGSSLLESGCEFCGACLDVCPVGALVERDHKWDKAERVQSSVCPNCSVGCQMNLEINRREKVVRAIPELYGGPNHGQACYKGKFGMEFVNHKNRLRRPLIRRNGKLEDATWDEALAYLAERLPEYKGEQFAALASARTTNEGAYILQRFSRGVMGSNNVDVDSNTRPALARALEEPLGYAASTNAIWELENAECILAVDANLTEDHNVLGVPIKQAVKKGASLLVVDSREVELTRYAHLWLRPRPGTTLTLLWGVLRVLVEEHLVDQEFVDRRCHGLDTLKSSLESISLSEIAGTCGIPAEQIQQAARTFAEAETSAIAYALDNVAREEQTGHVHAMADLALVTGNVGKPSSGLYPLRHGGNEQGATDAGAAPDLLPGYRSVKDEDARRVLEAKWQAALPPEPGIGLSEMLEAARDGRVKAMLLLGDSHNYTNGELGDGLQSLESLEFLVVQDNFLSGPAQRADVVLPGPTFAEEDGTFTNLERRVQIINKALSPSNMESRPAWRFLSQIAQKMGSTAFGYESSSEVFKELASVSPIYAGISHERIRREAVYTLRPDPTNPQPTQMLHSEKVAVGLQWPCEEAGSKGTPILYTEGFPTGRAALMPFQRTQPRRTRTEEFPMVYVPGRVLAQEERDVTVEPVGNTNYVKRDEVVEINPQDAERAGIREYDEVEVVTRSERRRGVAAVPEWQHVGVVSMTTLFGDLATRLQASEDPDPMVKVPGLAMEGARLEKPTE